MIMALNVIPSGFEPETVSLEVRCSIQLSYETIAVLANAKILSFCKCLNF